MHGTSVHGNQEIPAAPIALRKRRAGRGTHKGTPFMHVIGKSDRRVLPEKVPNKRRKASGGTGGKAVDQGERDGGTHGPGTETGCRVTETTGRSSGSAKGQRTTVHNAPASRRRGIAAGQLLSASRGLCTLIRWSGFTPISEIRAVCVRSACTDLCGGAANRHPYRDRPIANRPQDSVLPHNEFLHHTLQERQRLAVACQLYRTADVADVLFAVVDAQLVIDRGDEVGHLDGRVFYEHAIVV